MAVNSQARAKKARKGSAGGLACGIGEISSRASLATASANNKYVAADTVMRGSVGARFDYLSRGGVVFGVRTEARNERKNGGVGGGWEDKANQTVNNCGTAERKEGESGAGWRCRGRGGGRGRAKEEE